MVLEQWFTPLLMLAIALASVEIGYQVGRRVRAAARARAVEEVAPQLGMVLGATLGLLGLLLAFSFGATSSRIATRQDVIVKEANAIGTAALRAGLLGDPASREIRRALLAYAEKRVELFEARGLGEYFEVERASGEMLPELWLLADKAAKARPDLVMAVVPPINDVMDVHSERAAVARQHLHPIVLAVLGLLTVVSLGTLGYGCGLAGRAQRVLTGAFALLAAGTLWITVDMDYPRHGLIRVDGSAMTEVAKALRASLPVDGGPPASGG